MSSQRLGLDDGRLGTESVLVAEKQNALAGSLSLGAGLDPLAPASTVVHGSQEAEESILGVGAVVLAHDRLDGLGGLVGVVEGNGADVVVQDVSLGDAVEEVATDESHLAINRGSGTTDVVPFLGSVVRE